MVRIVIDSALNIPVELVERFGIGVVPVSLSIDGKNYRENVDASRSELVSLIAAAENLATSQPAPGDFLEVYDAIGGDILSLHVTARASGTYQTAGIAASMTSARVKVIDTASATMGGGWLALTAALCATQGKSAGEIIEVVEKARGEITTLMSVPTLKYLSRSGRVNFAKALIASLLSVKPVMAFNDGLVEVVSRARTMSAAVKEMADMLKEKYGDRELAVAVMHAEDEALAAQCHEALAQEINVKYTITTDLTASLVVHGGPGSIAVAAIPFEYVSELSRRA